MTTPLWKRIIARILEALLAIIFISPLVWVIICSFSPQAGSAQSKGWGVANYLTLFGYQEGLPKYLFNSVIVTLVAVVFSVVTVGLLAFLEAWNNFMIPLYLSSSSKSTLPLAMVNMRQQTMGVIDYGATEAGVVILLIPCAILFLALQKYYVKGFMAGAVKG